MKSYTEEKIQEIKYMLDVYKNRISDYPTGHLFFPLYRKFQEDLSILEEKLANDVMNLEIDIRFGKVKNEKLKL